MVLSDADILTRIAADQLLSDHVPGNVRNCAYTLRAGKIFLPETGEEDVLNAPAVARRHHVWQIGPSEVLVVRTRERVRMPDDLCATYAPLYRLSRQGVMLLNASLVEPGYDGPLSCFLVNFSSQTITIGPNDPIAKITFVRLSRPPATLRPETFADGDYESGLSASAKKFHRSFMDVASIADHAADKATKSTYGAIRFGGIVVALLLFWAQLEPLFSSWLRKIPGWPMTTTERAADAHVKLEIESKLKELGYAQKSLQLEAELQRLKAELEDLKSRAKK
jgi:deoxycytidine triphosphate deaminase